MGSRIINVMARVATRVCGTSPRIGVPVTRLLGVAVALLVLAVAAGDAQAQTTATANFIVGGTYQFTVPVGVTTATVAAVGGAGGACVIPPPGRGEGGGRGAAVSATVGVSPGEKLSVGVGGPGRDSCGQYPANGGPGGAGGVGGGGAGGNVTVGSPAGTPGGGGGGASLVGVASPSPGFPGVLVVAGGGGGANGYAIGGDSGASGGSNVACNACGKGGAGSLTAGGAGGSFAPNPGLEPGTDGSFGLGGKGGSCTIRAGTTCVGGAGGGGGYYGGGGGGASSAGGGGGGSSFAVPGATDVSVTLSTAAPGVSITYAAPTADESPTAMRFGVQAPGTGAPAQTITVTNKGSAPLVVTGILLGGADPGDFVVGDRCQQPVPPGSSCQLGVRFAPQVEGARAATLTLLTNAASPPPPVALSGGANLRAAVPGGEVELLTCNPAAARQSENNRSGAPLRHTCTGKVIRGAVTLTATSTRVTLARGGAVLAKGASAPTAPDRFLLVPRARRVLKSGPYTLILRHPGGHGWVTRRVPVTVR